MTWDEFRKRWEGYQQGLDEYTKTDIQCPECGEYLYRDDSVLFASNPPKQKYFCRKCRWVGYA